MPPNQSPLLRHLRSWRNPPNLDRDPEEERRANWLELFYDLVYIATVIQLGTYLHHHLTVSGALQYGFLFLIVWWSWSGTTYYGNRFVTDDALHRLLVFVQISAVGNLAVSIPTAFGAGGATFALSYVALRVLLVLMYARAYRHERDVRPLIRNYVAGFLLGILFWLVSAFVPPPWRYALWGLGIGAEVLVHFAFGTQRFEQRAPFNLSHLSERYALFIIIVLGDTFIKAIGRVAEEGITTNTNLFGALAVLMAVSLWWVYFDDVAGAALRQGYETLTWWVYAHLPLSATLVAFGVAAEDITQLEPDQALELPLNLKATEFQTRVWQALREVPYGETRSYAELARMIGQPTAVRAVARALATNPVALVIPCHRIVRANGELSGYRWGTERKEALIAQERRGKLG